MDYNAIGYLGLDDEDAKVRIAAIDTLWIDESIGLMKRLIKLSKNDPSVEVRAAAASELGRFIYLGEMEEIPESAAHLAQETVINLWNNADEEIDVRRRALEAIANCSHKMVPSAIREAYESVHYLMRVSSIFAMGRTYDEQWSDIVMEEIKSDENEMRYEAVRAAGHLEIVEAIPILAQLSVDEDREIQLISIWSLGEIGGLEAMRVLDILAKKAIEDEDEDLQEAVDDALGNATLMSGLGF